MTLNAIVRKISKHDANVMVSIHLKSFQGFFLTFLGPKFLSILYQSIIEDPSGFGFITEKSGGAIAFVIGSTQPSGLFVRLLRKNWWQFSYSALPAFIKNPTILPRLFRAFSMPKQKMPSKNCATLMSIAVDPLYQGQGIGNLLVQAFLDEAHSRKVVMVNLTTDAENNETGNKFYQKLGFVKFRTYTTPEKRIMNEYIIELRENILNT